LYKAYHWPGFPSGEAYDATNLLRLVRQKAFEIQNRPEPPLAAPVPPRLLPIAAPSAISWQGSAGAVGYDVERAGARNGPWTLVGAAVDDTAVQYAPLFSDDYAEPGETYFYRVRASSAGGRSDPSNVVGPVTAGGVTIVDQLRDASRLFARSARLRFETGDARKTKEDAHRLAGGAGEWVVYRTRRPLAGAVVQAFFPAEARDAEFSVSSDGIAFTPVIAAVADFSEGKGDYGYHAARRYTLASTPAGQYFLRIAFAGEMQIGMIEVRGDR
jgi:mannan endo-1,4-beta-mannosidase